MKCDNLRSNPRKADHWAATFYCTAKERMSVRSASMATRSVILVLAAIVRLAVQECDTPDHRWPGSPASPPSLLTPAFVDDPFI